MTHGEAYEIDTFKEKIIDLDKGAKHVAKISNTRRNKRILQRWGNRGIAGIKLPTIRIGAELYTSQEALNWFLNASQKAQRLKHSRATSAGIAKSQDEANRQRRSQGTSGELAKSESDIEQEARDLGI